MNNFEVGKRYPMTKQEAESIMKQLWPAVIGTPDLSRGRLFVKSPCDWEFWTTDKKKVSFSFSPGHHFIGSVSRDPDPNYPEPL